LAIVKNMRFDVWATMDQPRGWAEAAALVAYIVGTHVDMADANVTMLLLNCAAATRAAAVGGSRAAVAATTFIHFAAGAARWTALSPRVHLGVTVGAAAVAGGADPQVALGVAAWLFFVAAVLHTTAAAPVVVKKSHW
jgi:hypothetical protein